MIVAAIDIGTNSVKMVVGEAGHTLYDGVQITRLGKGIAAETGALLPDAVERTLATLSDLAERAYLLGAERVAAVGTSALRDAGESGAAFVKAAEEAIGGTVEVISGEREAELTYLSARHDPDLAIPEGVLLCTSDIGGGSTEIVQGGAEGISSLHSLQMGAVRLTEGYLPSNPPTVAEINAAEAAVRQVLQIIPKPDTPLMLVASGGTAANLAGMWLAATGKPVNVNTIHGVRLDRCTVSDFLEQLAVLPWAERRETPGLEPARADVIVAGALLQVLLMEHLNVGELVVSARGLRYGLLYELQDGGAD